MKSFQIPAFAITSRTLELVASLSEKTGAVNTLFLNKLPEHLQQKQMLTAVYTTLKLEGLNLTDQDVAACFENNENATPEHNPDEIGNTLTAYQMLAQWHPFSKASFASAHQMLMQGLADAPGEFRTEQVELKLYRKKISVAPDAKMVLPLMNNLFSYVKTSRDLLLIRSCVFYYEMTFIHPFKAGNGRMARLWLKVLLNEYNPLYKFLPIESLMLAREHQLIDILSRCRKSGKSSLFIEFMLSIIDEGLQQMLLSKPPVISAEDRMEAFRQSFVQDMFTRKEYLQFFKNISTATASRDLLTATDQGIIHKTGDKNQTVYRFRTK